MGTVIKIRHHDYGCHWGKKLSALPLGAIKAGWQWLGYSQPQIQGWIGRFSSGVRTLVSGSQAFEGAMGTLSWDRDHGLVLGNKALVDETREYTVVMVSDRET